jgi:hypothetical protein
MADNWWEEDTLGDSTEASSDNWWEEDAEEAPQNSGELDLDKLQARRDAGEADDNILKSIVEQAGPNLKMDGQPFAINDQYSSTALLDFILSGNVVDNSIDSRAKALVKGVGTGSTDLLGLPVDLANTALQSGEGLFRRGINALGGDVSTDPEDYMLSSTNPIGGGTNIRNTLEAGLEATGLVEEDSNTYVDSREEIPSDFRSYFQVGRIATEGAVPALSVLKAAKVGVGLSNPIIAEAAANPALFAKVEAAATSASGGLAALTEAANLGDNPWVLMGAEFLGAILGGSTAAGTSFVNKGTSAVGKSLETLMAAWSKTAANKGAVNDILLAAKDQREYLIERANVALEAGDTARYDQLMDEADAHTPERIIQDLETALAAADDSPVAGVYLPAGTLTDNPTLQSIQNALSAGASNFSETARDQINAALSQILATSEALARGGNKAAADTLKQRYFQNLLGQRILNTQLEASRILDDLGPNITQQEASAISQRTLFEAKNQVGEMESFLYDRIDGSLPVDASELAETIDAIRNNKLLGGETIAGGGQLDAAINIFYSRVTNPDAAPLTVKEMRTFRSRMLAAARDEAAKNEFTRAGIYDELASITADIMGAIPYEQGGEAIETARRFSAEKNLRFTRFFTLKALGKKSTGGADIRPEQVLEEAMSGSPINRAENMGEMREAAEFTDTMALRVDELFEQELRRYAATEGVDLNELPLNISGPESTEVGPVGPFAERMRQSDKPKEGAKTSSQQNADLLFKFARSLEDKAASLPPSSVSEREELLRMAEIARQRAANVGETRGPSGEEYFDPTQSDTGPEETPFVAGEDGTTTRIDGTEGTREEPKANEVGFPDDATPTDLAPTMSAAQEEFLRGAVLRLRGPDNKLDVKKLEQFMSAKENSEVLKGFPNFKAELASLIDAQRIADKMYNDFQAIADTGTLPDAIRGVLDSADPVSNFSKLADETLGDVNARRDLRMATIDALFDSVTVAGQEPDFIKLTAQLTQPLSGRAGDKGILELMQEKNIISAEDTELIGGLIAEGLRIQMSRMDQRQFDQVISETGDMVSNAARILGANFGAMFGMGEGSQLQAAAIGSAAFKKLVAGLPIGNKLEQMKLLMLEPRMLLAAIKGSPTIRRGAIDGFKEFLIQYGSEFKGLSKTQATGKILKDATVGAARATGRGIGNMASQAPIASSSAFSDTDTDENKPTVTIDEQMMGLNLPPVDLPSLYPSDFLDEEGNPK